jgi:hypothetical protein
MIDAIQHMFANVTAHLEDLHAIAVEGQRADNSPDMQTLLNIHLRSGLVTLDSCIRAIAMGLEGGAS